MYVGFYGKFYFCLMLTKIGFFQQIFGKKRNEVSQIPCVGIQVVPRERADVRPDMTRIAVAVRFAKAPINTLFVYLGM